MRMVTIVASLIVVIMMSATALFAQSIPTLTSPLSGNFMSRTVTSPFGANWNNTYCGGLIKKHTGIDVQATAGENVYAAYSGYVKIAQTDATWGGYVSIDHAPTHTFLLVTTYWHVIPTVSPNTWVGGGTKIGTIANLGSNTHFHFQRYHGPWTTPTAYAGSLPQTICGGYPAFPNNFVNPASYSYNNK